MGWPCAAGVLCIPFAHACDSAGGNAQGESRKANRMLPGDTDRSRLRFWISGNTLNGGRWFRLSPTGDGLFNGIVRPRGMAEDVTGEKSESELAYDGCCYDHQNMGHNCSSAESFARLSPVLDHSVSRPCQLQATGGELVPSGARRERLDKARGRSQSG